MSEGSLWALSGRKLLRIGPVSPVLQLLSPYGFPVIFLYDFLNCLLNVLVMFSFSAFVLFIFSLCVVVLLCLGSLLTVVFLAFVPLGLDA